MVLLVGNGKGHIGTRSDGSASSVEGEPLSLLFWVSVGNLQVELSTTNVVSSLDSSVSSHLGEDLELDSVGEWLLWILESLLVNLPALVLTIVAIVPDNMSVVGVGSTVDIEALASHVSEGLSVGVHPLGSLVDISLPWSDDGISSSLVLLVDSDGDGVGSLGVRSDGLGSGVENEPLLGVLWVGVSDSESVVA